MLLVAASGIEIRGCSKSPAIFIVSRLLQIGTNTIEDTTTNKMRATVPVRPKSSGWSHCGIIQYCWCSPYKWAQLRERSEQLPTQSKISFCAFKNVEKTNSRQKLRQFFWYLLKRNHSGSLRSGCGSANAARALTRFVRKRS